MILKFVEYTINKGSFKMARFHISNKAIDELISAVSKRLNFGTVSITEPGAVLIVEDRRLSGGAIHGVVATGDDAVNVTNIFREFSEVL